LGASKSVIFNILCCDKCVQSSRMRSKFFSLDGWSHFSESPAIQGNFWLPSHMLKCASPAWRLQGERHLWLFYSTKYYTEDFLLAFSMNPVPKTSWCINAKSIFKWRESLEIGTIANKSRKSFCGWIRRRTLWFSPHTFLYLYIFSPWK